MPFSLRRIALVPLLGLALVAAGCGGDGSGDVPEGAIAVVGEREIPKSEFDRVLEQAERSFKARKQTFPAAGSQEYDQLKNAIVRSLVEQTQLEIGAEELGVKISEEDVDKRVVELKEQFFQGDEKKYEAELKKQGLTDQQVREDVRSRLLSERIFAAVTKDVKVTEADVQKFYDENKADFETPASRDVRHILVKKKAKADELYAQLRSGGNFAQLAKKFSQDPSSKDQGGKFTAQKGQTVPPFDKTVFSLETGELSKPVKTEFGWHVIEALSAIKPKSQRPLSEVAKDIRSQLLEDKKNEALNTWVKELKERLAADVAYAVGYRPPAQSTTTEGATVTAGTETQR
jgi:foldase protein PrsA